MSTTTIPILPSTLNKQPIFLPLEPLTPASFAPFGTAISPAFASSLNTPPTSIPSPLHAPHQPVAVFANQQSALKTSPISAFENRYPDAPGPIVKPLMSMFSCFPRNLSGIGIEEDAGSSRAKARFRVNILERHPYTTQTFSPLGLSTGSESEFKDENRAKTFFLVIVAPSLKGTTVVSSADESISTSSPKNPTEIKSPPDLACLRAFIARGDQAVTYGAGTWHAPMVVLGERRVDFLVTQFVNGVADDDCQEVLLGEHNAVFVGLDGLGLDLGSAPIGDSNGERRTRGLNSKLKSKL